jgi:hypothetical protein
MKTTIERMRESIEQLSSVSISDVIKESLLHYCDVLYESEKDDIRKAFDKGYRNGSINQDKINNGQTDLETITGNDYYNETFKSE